MDWEQKWYEELPSQSLCPNYYLNQNIDYIRYLYRLLSISYSYEAIKDYNISLYRLGLNDSKCSFKWKDVSKKCTPKSMEMKKFLRRAKYKYLSHEEQKRFVLLSSDERKKWISQIRSRNTNNSELGITESRVNFWCRDNKLNCSKISMNEVEKIIEKSCEREQKLINDACSENDSLYGISYSDIPLELLEKANTLTVINTGGYGKQCLKRFTTIFKKDEYRYDHLENLFLTVKRNMEKESHDYLQGALFLPGALKEFDDKGLGDFIFAKPTPKPVAIIKPTPAPKPIIVKKPKPVVVKVKPKPKPTPKPVVTPAPIKYSQFEIARKKRVKTNADSVSVNMELFKDDFFFSDKMKELLEAPLKDYQTRQALLDMKKYDGLGSEKEPVRLSFLKYFIDGNNHQALYNIQAILGSSFWVRNDIDNIDKPTYISFENSAKTNNLWGIFIKKASQ